MPKTIIKNWNREAVTALIEVYKSRPCLYDVKSIDYHNREKGRVALEEMMLVVSEFYPIVTEEDCKKKYQSLRNQFCKEYTKVLISKGKSDSDVTDVYTPKLWCYEQLLFLKEFIHQKKGAFIGCSQEEMFEVEYLIDEEEEEMNAKYFKETEEDCELLSVLKDTPKTQKRKSEIISSIPTKKSNSGGKSSPMLGPGSSRSTTTESESLSNSIQMYLKKREEKRAVNTPTNKYTAFGNFVGSWLHENKNKAIRKKCMRDILNIIIKYEVEDSNSD